MYNFICFTDSEDFAGNFIQEYDDFCLMKKKKKREKRKARQK